MVLLLNGCYESTYSNDAGLNIRPNDVELIAIEFSKEDYVLLAGDSVSIESSLIAVYSDGSKVLLGIDELKKVEIDDSASQVRYDKESLKIKALEETVGSIVVNAYYEGLRATTKILIAGDFADLEFVVDKSVLFEGEASAFQLYGVTYSGIRAELPLDVVVFGEDSKVVVDKDNHQIKVISSCGETIPCYATIEANYENLKNEHLSATHSIEIKKVDVSTGVSVSLSTESNTTQNTYGAIVGTLEQLRTSVTDSSGQLFETNNITYQSSDENVATVTKDGLVKFDAVGEATITATYQLSLREASNSASITFDVKAVTANEVITMSSTKAPLIYEKVKLSTIGILSDDTTYDASNKTTYTVSPSGSSSVNKNEVTFYEPGTYVVTPTYNGYSYDPITINAVTLKAESLVLSIDKTVISVGDTVNVTVTAKMEDGSWRDVTANSVLTFGEPNNEIVSVEGNQITALDVSEEEPAVTVTALYDGVESLGVTFTITEEDVMGHKLIMHRNNNVNLHSPYTLSVRDSHIAYFEVAKDSSLSGMTAMNPKNLQFTWQSIDGVRVQKSFYNDNYLKLVFDSEGEGVLTVSEGSSELVAVDFVITRSDPLEKITIHPNNIDTKIINTSEVFRLGAVEESSGLVRYVDNRNAIWTSSNTSIAMVTQEGEVYYRDEAGTVDITATSHDDDTLSSTFTVTVEDLTPQELVIQLSKPLDETKPHEVVGLQIDVKLDNGELKNLTFDDENLTLTSDSGTVKFEGGYALNVGAFLTDTMYLTYKDIKLEKNISRNGGAGTADFGIFCANKTILAGLQRGACSLWHNVDKTYLSPATVSFDQPNFYATQNGTHFYIGYAPDEGGTFTDSVSVTACLDSNSENCATRQLDVFPVLDEPEHHYKRDKYEVYLLPSDEKVNTNVHPDFVTLLTVTAAINGNQKFGIIAPNWNDYAITIENEDMGAFYLPFFVPNKFDDDQHTKGSFTVYWGEGNSFTSEFDLYIVNPTYTYDAQKLYYYGDFPSEGIELSSLVSVEASYGNTNENIADQMTFEATTDGFYINDGKLYYTGSDHPVPDVEIAIVENRSEKYADLFDKLGDSPSVTVKAINLEGSEFQSCGSGEELCLLTVDIEGIGPTVFADHPALPTLLRNMAPQFAADADGYIIHTPANIGGITSDEVTRFRLDDLFYELETSTKNDDTSFIHPVSTYKENLAYCKLLSEMNFAGHSVWAPIAPGSTRNALNTDSTATASIVNYFNSDQLIYNKGFAAGTRFNYGYVYELYLNSNDAWATVHYTGKNGKNMPMCSALTP